MNKRFHLSDVLSVSTGRLVSSRHMKGFYEILDWMTQDKLFTHQLPRARAQCVPWLLHRHPELTKIGDKELAELDKMIATESSTPEKTCERWVEICATIVGADYLDIETIPKDDRQHIDPTAEARRLMPNAKIIPMVLGEETDD